MTVVREPPAPMLSYLPLLNPAKRSKSKFSAASLPLEELKLAKERLASLSKKRWILIEGKDGCLVYSAGRKVPLSP